jgi:hypothetical protein
MIPTSHIVDIPGPEFQSKMSSTDSEIIITFFLSLQQVIHPDIFAYNSKPVLTKRTTYIRNPIYYVVDPSMSSTRLELTIVFRT